MFHSFPYGEGIIKVEGQTIFTFIWEDENGTYPVGYLPERVIDELVKLPKDVAGDIVVDRNERTVSMFRLPNATESERTKFVGRLSEYLRDNKVFPSLEGWRNELWPVYSRKGELLFSMERATIGLIGATRYGIHLSAYVKDESAPHGIKLWVPKRSANKSTFPGMLDNTVAGGLMTGEDYFECMVREADEEASLPEDVVRAGVKEVGCLTYIFITDEKNCGEAGLIFPEVEYAFDLLLPESVIPQPKDGEVEEFKLCDVEEIQRDLAAGKYKTNCAVVLLDFFIRHGILTERDPDYQAIKQRTHRVLPFPGPHDPNWRSVQ